MYITTATSNDHCIRRKGPVPHWKEDDNYNDVKRNIRATARGTS